MIVVFSGYNQRAVIAFLRTLEKNNLKYQIIASGEDDQIFLTRYKSRVVYTRKVRQLDLNDIATALDKVDKNETNLIAPSTEALNRFLLVNRECFEEAGFIVPLVTNELYEKISDKDKFSNVCQENNIAVPQEYGFSKEFEIPLVAKPKSYVSSDGKTYPPIFINNQNDLDDFINKHNIEDFYYQEYIEGGESIYLLFYFDKKGGFKVMSEENYVQQPDGKSIQCARVSHYHENIDIVQPYVDLFKKMKFRGMVMVELRKKDSVYYMIEANPRFWGPSQLFVDAGNNLFEMFLADYGLVSKYTYDEAKNVFYFWSNGILAQEIENSDLVFYGEGKEVFKNNKETIDQTEIYNRNDTRGIYDVERLRWLYTRTSKHSSYQILPDCLVGLIGGGLPVRPRRERERVEFIKKFIDLNGKHILDIGGNTGFFTVQSGEDGAKQIDYYEGNNVHADFVKTAAKMLNYGDIIRVHPEYFDFTTNDGQKYDVVFNLNVLHHMGDDFDSGKRKEQAKIDIINSINNMAKLTDIMVLQLGFNWKGDPGECLFNDGTKEELIEYVKEGTKGSWRICHIGIPVVNSSGNIVYEDVNDRNIKRDDALGEFLNRPLFIMESLK